MSGPTAAQRPWWSAIVAVALGELVVVGVAVAVVPQHAVSILRVALAAAVVGAVGVAVSRATEGTRDVWSPFERTSGRRATRDEPPGLTSLRTSVEATSPVPIGVWPANRLVQRRLRALTVVVAERHGLDLDDPAHRDRVVGLLGPEVVALATLDPAAHDRRAGHRRARPGEVAEVVHAVLDRLAAADASGAPTPRAAATAVPTDPRSRSDR